MVDATEETPLTIVIRFAAVLVAERYPLTGTALVGVRTFVVHQGLSAI
jgi:hypothetical protein